MGVIWYLKYTPGDVRLKNEGLSSSCVYSDVVEICVHVLSVVVESAFAVFCIAEGKRRYDVRAIESGEVFTIEKVGMLACDDVKKSTL